MAGAMATTKSQKGLCRTRYTCQESTTRLNVTANGIRLVSSDYNSRRVCNEICIVYGDWLVTTRVWSGVNFVLVCPKPQHVSTHAAHAVIRVFSMQSRFCTIRIGSGTTKEHMTSHRPCQMEICAQSRNHVIPLAAGEHERAIQGKRSC